MKTSPPFIVLAICCSMLVACQRKPAETTFSQANVEPIKRVIQIEPDDYFTNALETFAKGEREDCARFIRQAARAMGSIAAVAAGEQKAAIQKTAGELTFLANDVAKGNVREIEDLNYFFGRAGRTLAGYRLEITETGHLSYTPQQVGEFLEKAVAQLENNSRYQQRELSPKENQLIYDARLLAQRMQRGETIRGDEVIATVHKLKKQLHLWNDVFDKQPDRQK